MAFLLPFMQERKTLSNLEVSDDDDDDENECNKNDDGDSQNERENYQTDTEDKNNNSDNDINKKSHTADDKKRKKRNINKINKMTNNNENYQPEEASAVLMKYLLEKKNAQVPEQDTIDMFCSTIASKIKKFSPYYQNIAQSQIFSIVSDLEMK